MPGLYQPHDANDGQRNHNQAVMSDFLVAEDGAHRAEGDDHKGRRDEPCGQSRADDERHEDDRERAMKDDGTRVSVSRGLRPAPFVAECPHEGHMRDDDGRGGPPEPRRGTPARGQDRADCEAGVADDREKKGYVRRSAPLSCSSCLRTDR